MLLSFWKWTQLREVDQTLKHQPWMVTVTVTEPSCVICDACPLVSPPPWGHCCCSYHIFSYNQWVSQLHHYMMGLRYLR